MLIMNSMQNKDLTKAISAWKSLLGNEAVHDSPVSDEKACTFTQSSSVVATIQPRNLPELQECLRIAGQYKILVFPVSTGLNWGYGSGLPAQTAVVFDLSFLNEISDYDEALGLVTIQPGVTQTQLYEFLQQQGGAYWMDATGSSGQCSVLGNTLERGFGHSPYSNHAEQVVSMQVMLANGELIHTGMGQFKAATTANTYAAGLGPGLNQLFLQSNFAVVTSMTIKLMPAPEYFQAVYFSISDESMLPGLIDALQPLRLSGVIQSAMHIGNAYRVLSSIQQYPWEASQGKTPLPEDVLASYGKQWDFGAWNGSAGLYGTRKQVAEMRRLLRLALRDRVKKIRFMDDRSLEMAKRLQKPYQWLTGINLPEMLKLIEPVHNMMKGKPTERIIASTYWRKKMSIPDDMNPDRDRCGLIWCAHVAPTKGHHAREMTDIASNILLSHGFEPGMTLTMIDERNLDNVISISYDRDIEGEDERAIQCYIELSETLINKGYYPYRLGAHSMHLLSQYAASTNIDLLQRLKTVFDPHKILAPGRYIT